MKSIKRKLYERCQDYVQERIAAAQHAIEAARQSANSETKSSSGDKYETGRAMMQLEIEKNTAQLVESMKLKHALDQIRIDNTLPSIQAGSLVITDREVFFIAISLGKVVVEDKTYVVISPASPLGQKLKGLKTGDQMAFNDRTYMIKEII
ncbi:MAG TPA: 3-oxoacyl-ACP synthase [Chryseosolibacter sp.]|nr:3-oxoacyl-ACP synthase [Chryseosolibacter sp.]